MKANLFARQLPRFGSTSVIVLLLVNVLGGCVQSPTDQGPKPESGSYLPAQVQTPVETATVTPLERSATKIALYMERDYAVQTRIASGTPFRHTPIPIATARPMPMPPPGISWDCVDPDPSFHYGDCWTGMFKGEYLFVSTGALTADAYTGMLRVYTSTLDRRERGTIREYRTPVQSGILRVGYVIGPRMLLFGEYHNPTAPRLVFNLLSRSWEEPGACQLFPIGLHESTLSGGEGKFTLRETTFGASGGDFSWLNWSGIPLTDTLAVSLAAPGDSATYINPNNPVDHTVSVGDWISGRPQVINIPLVERALSTLSTSHFRIVMPVWDQSAEQGGSLRYRVSGFAWASIEAYNLEQPNRLTLRYWGPAACADST